MNRVVPRKIALLAVVACALLLASSHEAKANPSPLPPTGVPDGGATVLLLGTALGALGMARRFLKR